MLFFLVFFLPSSKPGLIKQRRSEKTTALPVAGPAETSVGGSVQTPSGDAGWHLFSPVGLSLSKNLPVAGGAWFSPVGPSLSKIPPVAGTAGFLH